MHMFLAPNRFKPVPNRFPSCHPDWNVERIPNFAFKMIGIFKHIDSFLFRNRRNFKVRFRSHCRFNASRNTVFEKNQTCEHKTYLNYTAISENQRDTHRTYLFRALICNHAFYSRQTCISAGGPPYAILSLYRYSRGFRRWFHFWSQHTKIKMWAGNRKTQKFIWIEICAGKKT